MQAYYRGQTACCRLAQHDTVADTWRIAHCNAVESSVRYTDPRIICLLTKVALSLSMDEKQENGLAFVVGA